MARGLDRQLIFRDDRDRDDFVARLRKLAETGAIRVYAWTLLPNHFHLLVRTGKRPLARAMRSLLTGYAGVFNRRHRRRGHLFQNRYKSIAVDEEPYLLELVRYLHLNPLRAGVVRSLRDLDRYPYSGHAALVGTREFRWQATGEVLGRFGAKVADARKKYRAFVAEGRVQGRRPELMGGGLVRSAGGWAAVRELRHGREGYASDERILGGTDFVLSVLRELEGQEAHRRSRRGWSLDTVSLIEQIAKAEGMTPERIRGAGRPRNVSRVRDGIAYLWVECLGRSGRALARELGLRAESVNRAARRGQERSEFWRKILKI
jgi:REP element-mobilizing transposase RayT